MKLVKAQQNTDIERSNVQVKIAEQITRGEISTADDLAKLYNIPFSKAVSLLSSPKFIQLVGAITKANAQLAWHGIAFPKLMQLLKSDDEKVVLQAMKLLGQLTDSLKGGLDINVNLSLENLVRESEVSVSNNLKNVPAQVYEMEEYRRIINE